MAYDSRSTKLEAIRVDSIHLDQAHPLVGIPRADLGPGQGLRDRRRELFGSIHRSMIFVVLGVSSFLRR
jgi:hypothetical protein